VSDFCLGALADGKSCPAARSDHGLSAEVDEINRTQHVSGISRAAQVMKTIQNRDGAFSVVT
jgi:hypothetical protein